MNTLMKQFKQGIVITELEKNYENNEKEENILKSIKGGMCYMLSIEWLMRLLDDNSLSPMNIFPDLDNYDDNEQKYHYSKTSLAYFMQIADNFYKYSSDIDLINSSRSKHPGAEKISHSIFTNSDEHYVELCSNGRHSVINWDFIVVDPKDLIPDAYINIITGLISNNKGLLLEICVNEKVNESDYKTKLAHAMAIWQHENKYYFFDPNFGIYEANDLVSFLDETEITYEDLYQRKYKKSIDDIDSIKFVFSEIG